MIYIAFYVKYFTFYLVVTKLKCNFALEKQNKF